MTVNKTRRKKKAQRKGKKLRYRSKLLKAGFKSSLLVLNKAILRKKRKTIMSFAKKYFLIKLSKKIFFCKKKKIQFYFSSVIFKNFRKYLFNYPFYIIKRRLLRYISFFSFLKEKIFLKKFFPLKNLFFRHKKTKKLLINHNIKREYLKFNYQASFLFLGSKYRLKNFKMLKMFSRLI